MPRTQHSAQFGQSVPKRKIMKPHILIVPDDNFAIHFINIFRSKSVARSNLRLLCAARSGPIQQH